MRKITEETILFISVIKWFVLATVAGLVVGLATGGFLQLLRWATLKVNSVPYYFLLLPLALFLSSLITKLAPEAEGHGTEKVIEAIHKRSGRIKAAVVPVKLVTTIITLIAGGSVGKEGPCAQIGGGLASILADLLKFGRHDRRKLVICGISAGFAAVFGTPIAGAIFGIEVLVVGGMMYDVLLPSFIAGVMGYQISAALGVTYFYHVLDFVPHFSELFFSAVVLAGVFFGICSLMLIETMGYMKHLSDKLVMWEPLKAVVGGLAMVVLALLFSTKFLGLGLNTIESMLQGGQEVWWAFAVKILFTAITLSFGGSGGIVTPIFFIGATAGSLYAQAMGLDQATFAAIGMVSLLAGAANTPIAASILAVELFGSKIAPFAAAACVTSFLMTGHRSVYPSQVYAIMKSSSFRGGVGHEVEDMHAELFLRRRSLTRVIVSLIQKIFEKRKPH